MAKKAKTTDPEKKSAAATLVATKAAKKSPKTSSAEVRKLKPSQTRRLFGLLPPKKVTTVDDGTYKVASAPRILQRACQLLVSRWELFGGILLVYLVIDLLLVGSGLINSGDLRSFKSELSDTFAGQFGKFDIGITLFAFLVSSGSGVAGGISGAYQTVVLILISLVLIYALRQTYAGYVIRVRDAFYGGTYPLVQSILVLLMVGLNMVPGVLAGFLATVLLYNGILTAGWQQVLVGIGCFLLLVWSLYMLCSSLFALYIVTLPNMTPLKALRSAKEVTAGRRVMVLRKLLFLPLALMVAVLVVMIPLALFVTLIAPSVLFVLSVFIVGIVHSYMYGLYRELIAGGDV